MAHNFAINDDVHHQQQGPQGRATAKERSIYTIVTCLPIEADGRPRYRIKSKTENILRPQDLFAEPDDLGDSRHVSTICSLARSPKSGREANCWIGQADSGRSSISMAHARRPANAPCPRQKNSPLLFAD